MGIGVVGCYGKSGIWGKGYRGLVDSVLLGVPKIALASYTAARSCSP